MSPIGGVYFIVMAKSRLMYTTHRFGLYDARQCALKLEVSGLLYL